MTRFNTVAALGALIFSSTVAFAALPAAASVHHQSMKYSQHCTSLAGQWRSAMEGHETSAHLGRAKADAARGAKLCHSQTASKQRRGAADYRAALKLLGVRPV